MRKSRIGGVILLGAALATLCSCSQSGPLGPNGSPAPVTPDEFVAKLQSLPPGKEQMAYAFKWPGEIQYIRKMPDSTPAKQKLLAIMYQDRPAMPGPGSGPKPAQPGS